MNEHLCERERARERQRDRERERERGGGGGNMQKVRNGNRVFPDEQFTSNEMSVGSIIQLTLHRVLRSRDTEGR